jgi:sphingolipid delta-4 desaturase
MFLFSFLLHFYFINSFPSYHNEHHDFPNIPWSRLPALRQLAAEYYDSLPYHESWPLVTWKFVFTPEVGLWNRVKRRGNVRMQMVKEVAQEDSQNETEEERRDRIASQTKVA